MSADARGDGEVEAGEHAYIGESMEGTDGWRSNKQEEEKSMYLVIEESEPSSTSSLSHPLALSPRTLSCDRHPDTFTWCVGVT